MLHLCVALPVVGCYLKHAFFGMQLGWLGTYALMVRWSAQGINLVVLEGWWRGLLVRSPIVLLGHWSRGSYPLKTRTLPSFSLHFSRQQNWLHCVIWGGKESAAPPIHLGFGVCFEQRSSQHWLCTCTHSHTQMRSGVLSALNNQRETPAGRAIDASVTGWLFPIGEGGAGRREWAVL